VIVLDHISIQQGKFALSDVSLQIPPGAYAVLMGRTGSGKSTILETIIGFRRPVSGRVLLGGVDVSGWNPALRGIGYVPQDGALFSRMTVRDHLAFALRIRRTPRIEIDRRVSELARLLRIPHLLDRRPPRLSGGERQRVALGRALSFQPRILCLDEPLSALDDETRLEMINLLREVRRRTGVTTLHVTHNEAEAVALADTVFRITEGRILRQPSPGESSSADPSMAAGTRR
jgi:molybdate/tungstate transport system ATP-binding protein